MSSPEASSSSEDEFDLSAAPAMRSDDSAKVKAVQHSGLFSDDDDDDKDDKDAKDANAAATNKTASDDDTKSSSSGKEKGKEMEDLFGSDYDSEEEEFKASGIKESPVRDEDRAPPHDFHPTASDGANQSRNANEIWLPRTPKASKTASYFICKMPNILRLVPEPYTKQSILEEMRNPSDETLYRNYVRWRYQRDANGNVKRDPTTQLPVRESNAKLVQWADGSLTMVVGKETLSLSRQPLPNSFLFASELSSDKPALEDDDGDAETVLESHGRLTEKLTIRPTTTRSKSHKSLTMSMRAKHNKGVQRIKHYISEMDGEREMEQRAKINDDRLRLQNRKKGRQAYDDDRERSSRMDAGFLEEDDEGGEYEDEDNVGAIKEQYGQRSKSKSAARRPPPAQRRPSASSFRGDGFDEYSRSRAQEAARSDSEGEPAQDDDEDDDFDDEVVVRSAKRRRTVDEDDSD